MKLVILGNNSDLHANLVYTEARRRNVDVCFWDTLHFPADAHVSFFPNESRSLLTTVDGRRLELDGDCVVYWRNFNQPGQAESGEFADDHQAWIAHNDNISLIESVFRCSRARWVNGFDGYKLHGRKPECLAMVQQAGLLVPPTVVSNDIAVIRTFVEANGPAIFKPVHGGAHAGRIRPSHLTDENARSLQLAPVTIQQEIAGTNIRVFVAGDSVLACELQAETLDFRDDKNLRITKHELPASVAADSKRIAALLQLSWTGIDYRLSADGRYWFLEANFSPMFSEFERQSGAPILNALVDHLTAGQTGR